MARLKILSVDIPLEGGAVTVGGFGAAPSWSDYDAVVLDMERVSSYVERVVRGKYATHDSTGMPIVNSTESHRAGNVSLTQLIDRRTRELNDLLGSGGTIICFIYPPVNHSGVGTHQTWPIYSWLPGPIPNMYDSGNLREGHGPAEGAVQRHAFAQFFAAFAGQLRYRAGFDASVARYPDRFTPICRTRSGLIVAAEGKVPNLPGKLIFLPTIEPWDESETPTKAAGVLRDCVLRLLDNPPDEDLPEWVADVELPKLADLEKDIRSEEEKLGQARLRVDEARATAEEVARFKALLWSTGKFQLEPIVRQAFRALGFRVEEGDRDVVLFEGDVKLAIAEVEGTLGQVDVDKFRQLLDYVQDELQESSQQVKGILVGNGHRLDAPDLRGDQFTDHCRRGAETQGYCLLPTTELLKAVCAVLADPMRT